MKFELWQFILHLELLGASIIKMLSNKRSGIMLFFSKINQSNRVLADEKFACSKIQILRLGCF